MNAAPLERITSQSNSVAQPTEYQIQLKLVLLTFLCDSLYKKDGDKRVPKNMANLHRLLTDDETPTSRRNTWAYRALRDAVQLRSTPGNNVTAGTQTLIEADRCIFLDALAVACVAKVGDVYAVSATFPPQGDLTLHLSENNDVTPDTKQFIEILWRDLQKLRTATLGRQIIEPQILRQSIFKQIYARGYKKVQSRFKDKSTKEALTVRLYDELEKILGKDQQHHEFIQRELKENPKFAEELCALFETLKSLKKPADTVPGKIGKIDTASEVLGLVDSLWTHVRPLLKHPKMEEYDKKFKDLAEVEGVGRMLEKLCSHHLAAAALIGLATDPSCKLFDSKSITIKDMKAKMVDNYWSNLSPLVDSTGQQPSTRSEIDALEIQFIHNKNVSPEKPCGVHAECKLLFDPKNELHRFKYIGVSKLSCFSCQRYIDAWNVMHRGEDGLNFCTRGSHGKLYPWSLDVEQDRSVAMLMLLQLKKDLVTVISNKEGYREDQAKKINDSTALSLLAISDRF